MLNHVPVLGTVFGLALLAYGLLRLNGVLQRAALVTFVLVALGAIPVYLTGGVAEETVERLTGVSEAAIEAHEEAAVVALVGVELLGAVALAALLLERTKWARTAMRSVVAIAFTSAVLMAWTANLGGRIRHTEVNPAAGQHQAGDDEGREGRP